MWLLARRGSPTNSLLGLAQSSDYYAEEVGASLCGQSNTAHPGKVCSSWCCSCPLPSVRDKSSLSAAQFGCVDKSYMSSSAIRKALLGAVESMIVSIEGTCSKAGDYCPRRTRQSPNHARRSSISSADCFLHFASTSSQTTAVRACVCAQSQKGTLIRPHDTVPIVMQAVSTVACRLLTSWMATCCLACRQHASTKLVYTVSRS